MLNQRKIDCFLSVARTGSFTKAAEELFSTRQSISTQIKSLETDIGYTLFERGANDARLNENGKKCFEFFTNQQELYAQLLDNLKSSMAPSVFKLGLLSKMEISEPVADVINIINNSGLFSEVELIRCSAEQIAESTAMDMCISLLPPPIEKIYEGHSIVIDSSQIVMYVSKNNPKAKPDAKLSDFNDMTFLISGEASDASFNQLMENSGFTATKFKRCRNLESSITELFFNNSVLVSSASLDVIKNPNVVAYPINKRVDVVCWWKPNEYRQSVRRIIDALRKKYPQEG